MSGNGNNQMAISTLKMIKVLEVMIMITMTTTMMMMMMMMTTTMMLLITVINLKSSG
jgi:hypothetical protein